MAANACSIAPPPPEHLSDKAKASLTAMPGGPTPERYPSLDDVQGWRQYVDEHNKHIVENYFAQTPTSAQSARQVIAGVSVIKSTPDALEFPPDHIILNLHGGGLIFMGGEALVPLAGSTATRLRSTVISVDYRMPPDYPYPAGLDDCVAVYRALVAQYGAGKIIIYGNSAGGNLAAAVVLKARDTGLEMPRALVLQSPELDLTESGDTFRTLDGIDRLRSLMPVNLLYAAGADLADPYLSPLFGDFKKGFPPTFLQSGTRDLFLSNTVRMHRRLRDAGVWADLNIWDAMPHSQFGATPEDAEVDAAVREFIHQFW